MVSKKQMHRMPNGEMMEGPKHEATESAAERRKEYGSKEKKPARGGVRKRKSAIEGK